MATLTVDDVQEALTNVIDPELGLDFVELGLIYSVEIEDDEEDDDQSQQRHGRLTLLTLAACRPSTMYRTLSPT